MFLLRSAFWLTVAFLVIRPGVDVDTAARSMSASAMAAGRQIITDQVAAVPCRDLQCHGGKFLFTALSSTSPSATSTMQDKATVPVPFPRPRPDWMG